ncbi:F-box/FBD/LRR-repeat protein At1g13570-like isoform X2 [Tasmannia lanceolata]|uniref:F-box/FBD/LRR-repeat protein At1g13570-like isoform X2 n=1 Tax=Tasmannia lanceolata TaxID=3420 RepID=UPI00406358FA
MGETRTYFRHHHHAKEDRISKLSNDILGSILSLLPMKEAARASILSKRFRYLFTSRPRLVLDHQLLPAPTSGLSTGFKYLFTSFRCLMFRHQRNGLGESGFDWELTPHEIQKWVRIVDQILSLRHHDSIYFCKIADICLDECPFDMDRFLYFLTKKGIRTLILKNPIYTGLYKVPNCVFYCWSLRILYLHNCALNHVPSFAGLHRLEFLKFYRVEMSEHLLTNLVSSCYRLKVLKLLYCPGIKSLEIEIPNLSRVVIFTYQLSVIRLKNAARLEKFSLKNYYINHNNTEEYKAFHLFLKDVARVKCLRLGYHMGRLCRQRVPENLSYHFPNLTILSMVIDPNNANDAPFFTVLLEGAPSLQNITLWPSNSSCSIA